MDVNPDNIGIENIHSAIASGIPLFNEKTSAPDFNRACDQILILLGDSLSCFKQGSYGTSVFLAITAIEETAKAEVGIYRRKGNSVPVKKSKDLLYSHISKHRMAVLPTVFMGTRLINALGEKRCEQILKEVNDGGLIKLREDSLYFSNINGNFVTPQDTITKNKSIEILMLALETADDRLVGYTEYSMIIGGKIDKLFDSIMD